MLTMALEFIPKLGKRISTKKDELIPVHENDDYAWNPEDVDHVIGIISLYIHAIEVRKQVVFKVSGCGVPWNTSTWAHLATVIEQIPKLLLWLRSNTQTETQLEFYEQGVERIVRIQPQHDSLLELNCVRLIDHSPVGSSEKMTRSELEVMLLNVFRTFIQEAQEAYPTLLQCPEVATLLREDTLWDKALNFSDVFTMPMCKP